MLTKLFQYSTVHSNRIESNSINSTIRNRLLLQLFISEMIHAKQWHYSLQQRLPVAFIPLILHEEIHEKFFNPNSTFRRQKSSLINSTCRRQGDLLSSLQDLTKAFQAFQLQDLPKAFQFFKDIPDIPVIHDIPDIPVIHDIPALQALLHIPVLPVPSSISSTSSTLQCFQYIQGFHPLQLYSILQLECEFYTPIGFH